MFVIISNYLKSLQEVDSVYGEHAAWLAKYYASGRILGSGRRVPPIGGLILARGESQEEIQSLLAEDPFVRYGMAQYEIFEFTPNPLPRRSAELETFLSKPIREGEERSFPK